MSMNLSRAASENKIDGFPCNTMGTNKLSPGIARWRISESNR